MIVRGGSCCRIPALPRPGALKVQDGQAPGFSCRTSSAELKHGKAYPWPETRIADAPTDHRNAFRIEAQRLPTLPFLCLCVPDIGVIFLWKTVLIILTHYLRANFRATEAALFGLSKVLVWQNRSSKMRWQAPSGGPARGWAIVGGYLSAATCSAHFGQNVRARPAPISCGASRGRIARQADGDALRWPLSLLRLRQRVRRHPGSAGPTYACRKIDPLARRSPDQSRCTNRRVDLPRWERMRSGADPIAFVISDPRIRQHGLPDVPRSSAQVAGTPISGELFQKLPVRFGQFRVGKITSNSRGGRHVIPAGIEQQPCTCTPKGCGRT
jgi:hypothetical protein